MRSEGKITYINGPVVKGSGLQNFMMREMVLVGERRLIAEIIGDRKSTRLNSSHH